jgi:hypothetical protein
MKAQNDSGHLRWDKCEWWEEGYEALWRPDTPPSAETEDQPQSAHDDRAETAETSKTSPPKSARARATQSSVVYLTADASEELTELKPDESYIIGGVVDRNRYKVFLSLMLTVVSCLRLPTVSLPRQGEEPRHSARKATNRNIPLLSANEEGPHRESSEPSRVYAHLLSSSHILRFSKFCSNGSRPVTGSRHCLPSCRNASSTTGRTARMMRLAAPRTWS